MWGGKVGSAGLWIRRVTSQPVSKGLRLTDALNAKEREKGRIKTSCLAIFHVYLKQLSTINITFTKMSVDGKIYTYDFSPAEASRMQLRLQPYEREFISF